MLSEMDLEAEERTKSALFLDLQVLEKETTQIFGIRCPSQRVVYIWPASKLKFSKLRDDQNPGLLH